MKYNIYCSEITELLTIKTHLAPSAVHGIGLYAAESIPCHTSVWKFNRNIDTIYSHHHFLKVCREVDQFTLQHLLSASYKRGDRYYYLTDNARFINHSDLCPNTGFVDDDTEVSLRDIEPHEELLENYLVSYDSTDFFFQELCNPDPYQYVQAMIAL